MDSSYSARNAWYPPHPSRRPEVYHNSSYADVLAQARRAASTQSDIITIGVREPTLLPPPLHETWVFERGVDPESGADGFALECPSLNFGNSFQIDDPRKKRFRVNVINGYQVFKVKEEAARDRRHSNRYVEFFKRSRRVNLSSLEDDPKDDGFKHVTLNTANLLPQGASEVDLGYWCEEDRATGLKWHEFKVTWPGGPPNGEEETFHFSWKQRQTDLEDGVDSEYILDVTESPGAMVHPATAGVFSCKLRKWGPRNRHRVDLEISRGILGVQRQPAEVGHIWENMRWAVVVWSACYVYGQMGTATGARPRSVFSAS